MRVWDGGSKESRGPSELPRPPALLAKPRPTPALPLQLCDLPPWPSVLSCELGGGEDRSFSMGYCDTQIGHIHKSILKSTILIVGTKCTDDDD